MKKKTIEEAADKWFQACGKNIYYDYDSRFAFIAGAKYQSEQMYSEEEVKIYDKINKRIARQWFTDNDGNFYINSDPNGIQMSGKITIIQIGNNHPQYEIIKPKS
jgi:hypothetical protein